MVAWSSGYQRRTAALGFGRVTLFFVDTEGARKRGESREREERGHGASYPHPRPRGRKGGSDARGSDRELNGAGSLQAEEGDDRMDLHRAP